MSTPEQIQADIERQREQLARTIDDLGHKLDAKDRSTTDRGRPRPEFLGAAAVLVLGVTLIVWLRRRR
jgi:hypothetical protein